MGFWSILCSAKPHDQGDFCRVKSKLIFRFPAVPDFLFVAVLCLFRHPGIHFHLHFHICFSFYTGIQLFDD